MKSIVIFGGSGFVGTHLKAMIDEQSAFDKIYIADIRAPKTMNDRCEYVPCDVRRPSTRPRLKSGLLLSSILRPSTPAPDIPRMNILKRTSWAHAMFAPLLKVTASTRIIFTSSISVYGPGEDEKTEESVQMPNIPYGSSKAIAEYIHREWFLKNEDRRTLCILRPGVIYGPGEGGNFTRIANALEKGFFPLPGKDNTIKACLYVKDICRFIMEQFEGHAGYSLYNFCDPGKITIGDIVKAFKKTLGYTSWTPLIPLPVINMGVGLLGMFNVPFVRKMGMVPERIVKLVRVHQYFIKKTRHVGVYF